MTSQKLSARPSAVLPGCDLAPGQAYGSQAFSQDRPQGKPNRQMMSLLGLTNLTTRP
jgi:hypothetical protein